MSNAEDKAALMYSLKEALDDIGSEVSQKELVGYFTVLVFKDKKTGMLSSLEHHGANEYATSMIGFVSISQARLVNQVSNLESQEVDEYGIPISASDAEAYNRIDDEFDAEMAKPRDPKSKRKLDS